MSKIIKKHSEWKGDLSQYLQIGDLVDEEFAEYFINVLPPRTMNNSLIQMGEPYSHEENPKNGKYQGTYSTLKRTSEGWMYCGNCFPGETDDIKCSY